MSWKCIFVGLQIEYKSRGVPVRRGAPLFSPVRAQLLTTRKRAVVWPSATVRSPRGIALSAESARRCLAASTAQQAKSLPCHRLLPAKTCHRQLFAVYGGRRTRDGRRRTEVIKIGDLSFGGKSYQPGRRSLRCCGSGVYELFPDVQ